MKNKNIRSRILRAAALVFSIAVPVIFSGCSEDKYIYVDAATLTLSQYDAVVVPPEGGSIYITVETNQQEWTVTSDQPWCTVTPETGKFKITVGESPSTQELPAAVVTITAGPEYNRATETLSVKQTPLGAATLKLDPQDPIAFTATGGVRTISVETNQATWSVSCEQQWCTIEKTDGGFTVTAAKNTSTEPRPEAAVVVKAGPEHNQAVATLLVRQEGVPAIAGTNLGTNGTANCYIVPQAGDYFFSATIMGNNAVTPGISPKSLSPVKAELLWQDYFAQGEGLIKTVTLKDGYVSFSTYGNYHRGNAVIAVKDAQDKIIWSWHLWFSDDIEVVDIADQTQGGNLLYSLQDRNLGAVSATPGNDKSLGLYYQWGRKDPLAGAAGKGYSERTMEPTAFIGSSVTTQATTGYTYDINGTVNNSSANMIWKVGSEATDIETSVANPTTFYPFSRGLKPMTYDWLLVPNPGLWGNPWEGGAVYPAYSDKKCNSGKGSKSIYDPCPAGYRVIPMDTWVRAGVKAGSSRLTYDSKNYGFIFTILTSGGNLWFPLAGNRDHSGANLASNGSAGFCWTSSPFAGEGETQYMNSATISCSSMVFNNQAAIDRSWAYPVRCCKE